MIEAVQLLGGGVLLYFGAEWLVGGSSALALALRIPRLIVGLTVVAYGTSTPEVVISVEATVSGYSDVVIGNMIGSNVANIGLILGTAALIAPAKVDAALRRRELPVLVGSALLVPVLLLDGSVGRADGVILLLCGVGYTAWMIHAARSAAEVARAQIDTAIEEEAADAAGAPKPVGAVRAAATALFGLGVLLVGGKLFVEGAVSMAHAFGMSERLVGLTVVSLGTSLPELVTSIVAARRGHSDLAVGNVVGSNIFNVFLCLGAAGLAGGLAASLRALAVDLGAMLLMTIVAAAFIRSERSVSRTEGAFALALYVAYMIMTIARG